MNHLEKTFSDMQNACISYSRANESIWTSYTLIKSDYDALVKNAKDLDELIKAQSISQTEGHVSQKKQDMNALIKPFYKLCRSLCHLAKTNNNQVLLAVADIPESGFMLGNEKEMVMRYQSILDVARANMALLANYPVNAADLDGLQTKLNQVASLPETINLVSSTRKIATRGIKEVNAEARILLDRLDDAFEAIITDEKFLEGWFDARKIKGRHVSSKKQNVNTDNSNTGD